MLLNISSLMLRLLAQHGPIPLLAKIAVQMRYRRDAASGVQIEADDNDAAGIAACALERFEALGHAIAAAATDVDKEPLFIEYHAWRALVRQLPLPA
ncbi:MAG TPA: hypothetical protein VF427_15670 [Noviherbaspirillum sp.]